MLPYRGSDLASAFRTVRKNTIQIAEEIPEDKYGHTAAPGVRTVAQLLAHVAISYQFQHNVQSDKIKTFEGFNFPAFMGRLAAEEQKLTTKSEIVSALKTNGEKFASWLETLTDDFLSERVAMPGLQPPSKTRFEMLMGVKEHEMHHRGQLMLIERQLGIVPHLTRQMQERMAATVRT